MLVAEFAPQSGVVLTWPHARSDWRETLDQIVPVYIEITRAIAAYERLLILCYDAAHRDRIHDTLAQAGVTGSNILFACVPSNDTWIRDYGPLVTSRHGAPELHDFIFDGWDGRELSLRLDPVCQGLIGSLAEQRLQEAVSAAAGQPVALRLAAETSEEETPARREAREAAARQAETEADIAGDPLVTGLQEAFEAEIVPDSIRRIE